MHAMLNQIEHQLTGKADQRSLLLQYLYEIQLQYSHIPADAIDLLARKLDVAHAEIGAVIDFYAFLHTQPRGQFDILFSDSITDRMLGSHVLMQQLCERLGVEAGKPDEAGKVTISTTSCTGMCDQGPAILVNGLAVPRLDSERIDHIARLVEQETPLDQWPEEFFQVDNNIRRRGLLLQSSIKPGEAIHQLLDKGADKLLQIIDDSGLRGRGGAGFKTASKWRFCREADLKQRYVVCNADEGEPGTFKDRVLLQSYADEMIEGMTLCAGIIGAQHGLIYLRAEYRYLRDELQSVIQHRREQGLLGRNILGHEDYHFDIDIHMGAGAYICGEESALIESLEGKRGIPRNRPPFPVTHGYLNQPTVVNNVETFFAATKIAVNGAAWFRSEGTDQSSGSKLLSISGDCRFPGVYEYTFGTSIQEILADCGAENTQAVQAAGAAGLCYADNEFDRKISFEDISTGGSFMVFNQQRDMLDMVQNFTDFFVHESCGFCTPCRVGGSLLKDLVDKVHDGHAAKYDLQEIENICKVLQEASHCGLGQTIPNPILSTLKKFDSTYRSRLRSTDYEPAFDLNTALSESRQLTGRQEE